ncbi:MAG: Signal transduction histidine kinaselike protein [Sphaerisporangium sp.]|jgi:signal transduction histidine kinase|nr:Signal transduction histidine kinaselike protein [Sphaerisporangium sp.]
MGIEASFWRAIAVYRIASLAYAALLLAGAGGYQRPALGWLVIGVMALWTAATTFAYSIARSRPLLVIDMLVTVGCLLASPYVQGSGAGPDGVMPVTATWIGAPVLAWAVYGGRRAGAVAAIVLSMADLWLRGLRGFDLFVPLNGSVLLILAGTVVGHAARLTKQAEERLQRAAEMEAAGRERERLARGIHDSVLQVLALVQRRGLEIGGEAAELGRLAGEQETALREMVRGEPVASEYEGAGLADVGALLRRHGTATVTVSTPATPLLLPAGQAREVAAAVRAALDNVRRHCGEGTRAWVFAEGNDDSVTVTVRDEGPGIPAGRLAEAELEGRLGVAQSIRGRVAGLGGTVAFLSVPGQGTEMELTVPSPR